MSCQSPSKVEIRFLLNKQLKRQQGNKKVTQAHQVRLVKREARRELPKILVKTEMKYQLYKKLLMSKWHLPKTRIMKQPKVKFQK